MPNFEVSLVILASNLLAISHFSCSLFLLYIGFVFDDFPLLPSLLQLLSGMLSRNELKIINLDLTDEEVRFRAKLL